MRRTFGLGIASVLVALNCLASTGADQPKVIKISAKKFEFTPNEITLKKGVPVVLQLTSEDRKHGFAIDGMNLRSDIEPDKVTELKIDPEKPGKYDFYCDIFCGSGHEGMNGKITVTD